MKQSYDKLSEMVLFFSQRFHMEQLVTYGYEFLHENLWLSSSAIYVVDGDVFKLKSKKIYGDIPVLVKKNSEIDKIATLHGRMLTSSFDRYFDENFTSSVSIGYLIPLIVKAELIGFIIADQLTIEVCTDAHIEFIEKANILINNALSLAKADIDYQTMSKSLDREIFSLMFVNQSTRLLMSELDVDKLYKMCIDIVRELTASSITSLGLYDEVSDEIIIRGYNDIISFKEKYLEFKLVKGQHPTGRVIYHVRNDIEALKEVFVDTTKFNELNAEYVILIVKEKVIGFVTIGVAVNQKVYTQSVIDMVESMAASIYISIKNAQYFESIKHQSERITNQLSMLERMNTSIRNIQSSESINEMSELMADALNIGFGIEKVMVLIRRERGYRVESCVGMPLIGTYIDLNESFDRISKKDVYYHHDCDLIYDYFDAETISEIGVCNCLVVAPIITEVREIEEVNPSGYIIVTQTSSALKEEQILLLESLAFAVAPIVKQFNEVHKIKESYLPDEKSMLLSKLVKYIEEKALYDLDFNIYIKKIVAKPFKKLDLDDYKAYDSFYFDNYLFVMTCDYLDDTAFDYVLNLHDEHELFDFMETID